MNGISGLVKDTLPNYLSSLPIPDSFTGWFKLSCKCNNHIHITPHSITFAPAFLQFEVQKSLENVTFCYSNWREIGDSE